MTTFFWTLIAIQIVMGVFDTFYHHELTERLAWRPSQRYELQLHGLRNMLYAFLFVVLGWLEVHGIFAIAVIAVLVVEVVITLMDFVEEMRFERVGAFTYSAQEGTRAAELTDDVPEGVKRERLERSERTLIRLA